MPILCRHSVYTIRIFSATYNYRQSCVRHLSCVHARYFEQHRKGDERQRGTKTITLCYSYPSKTGKISCVWTIIKLNYSGSCHSKWRESQSRNVQPYTQFSKGMCCVTSIMPTWPIWSPALTRKLITVSSYMWLMLLLKQYTGKCVFAQLKLTLLFWLALTIKKNIN